MSSFTWLDTTERDRREALDLIKLFSEQGTVDELGVGTVRDAIADLLFPGTSTIQTRAKCFLLVPWVYLRLEGRIVIAGAILRGEFSEGVSCCSAAQVMGGAVRPKAEKPSGA